MGISSHSKLLLKLCLTFSRLGKGGMKYKIFIYFIRLLVRIY